MLLLVLGITLAVSGAFAKCNCASCEILVQAEFDQFRLFDCFFTNSMCTCLWKVLDITWCVVPSYDQQSYSLKVNTISNEESQYTRECRACLLATGKESCSVENVIPRKFVIEDLEIGFAVASILLEIYHVVTVVIFKAEKVTIDSIRAHSLFEAQHLAAIMILNLVLLMVL
jgi:hypothetical protein